jgi:hypothetical protein
MCEMQLHISKTNSVKELQDQFSNLFPFLNINFYSNGKTTDLQSGRRASLFTRETVIKDINPRLNDGELAIIESMNVADLEKGFYEKFGLSIQVLRRSGNLWLDTCRTNSWTLKEQNDHGREISPDQKTFPNKGSAYK